MNDIEKDCVKHYESGDTFLKRRISFTNELPEAPKAPPIVTHPLGDEFEAVVAVITDWKQRAIAAEKELERVQKHLKDSTDSKTVKQIKTDVLNSVMSMLDEYVGANCFPYLRAKIRDRLEV